MRIAFDCKGTLMNGDDHVVALFNWFRSKGCQMIIWSNSYFYAQDTAMQLGLHGNHEIGLQTKQTKWDYDCTNDPESYYFDIAVDDDSEQTYLAAKNFIWVRDIPTDPSKFEEAFGHLFK